jgi:L-ascorbate metabolism protein UlaG (beta-lactamase superfamily)
LWIVLPAALAGAAALAVSLRRVLPDTLESRAMNRILPGLAALVLLIPALASAQKKERIKIGDPPKSDTDVRIRWYGQSFFMIVTPKGTRIVTDPHKLDDYPPVEVKADLVLMSHFHTDHTATSVITNLKEARQYNALKKLDREGKRTEFNIIDRKFKDVRIQSMATFHDSSSGLTRGKNGVWIIDTAGLRIVHLGDLGHKLTKEQLKKLGTVDVLMVPAGGVYTLNPFEAYQVVKQIKPRRWVLPMHYGTAVFRDLLDLSYFLDAAKEDRTPVKKFGLNAWLSINPKSRLPKRWTLGILHY